jgi:hypothetical protein
VALLVADPNPEVPRIIWISGVLPYILHPPGG